MNEKIALSPVHQYESWNSFFSSFITAEVILWRSNFAKSFRRWISVRLGILFVLSFPVLQFKVIVTRPRVSYSWVKTCVNRMGPVVPQRILDIRPINHTEGVNRCCYRWRVLQFCYHSLTFLASRAGLWTSITPKLY